MQIQYGTGKYLVQGWHMSLPSVPQLKLRQQNDITKSISPALTDKPLSVESPPTIGELGTGYSLLDPVHNLCGLIHAHN